MPVGRVPVRVCARRTRADDLLFTRDVNLLAESADLLPVDLYFYTYVDASGNAMYYRIRVPVVSLDLAVQYSRC